MIRNTAFVLLLVFWLLATGHWTFGNVLLGAVLSLLGVLLIRHEWSGITLPFRPLALLRLAGLFARELALSVVQVVRLVLSPRPHFTPALFAFPLTVTSDLEIALLANLITLTPGTLSVDVSPDRKQLYVHALQGEDTEALCRQIATGFERAIKEALG